MGVVPCLDHSRHSRVGLAVHAAAGADCVSNAASTPSLLSIQFGPQGHKCVRLERTQKSAPSTSCQSHSKAILLVRTCTQERTLRAANPWQCQPACV
eukprot:2226913-Amphidinium_carterae.1